MSVAQRNRPWISPEEYLESEQHSPVRHEYINGEVFAMPGANNSHGRITGNLFALMHGHLRGKTHEPFVANMKVRVASSGPYYYPDIVVTCDDRDLRNDGVKEYPRLIVEVASPATEAFDRGKKYDDYTSLESLQEYVLIRQDKMEVECFRCNQQNGWSSTMYGAGDAVSLESIELTFPIEEIYDRVKF